MSDFEILFFTVVAVVIGYRLWSVLGRTNGDEAARAAQITSWAEKNRNAKESQQGNKNTALELVKNEAEPEEEIPAILEDGVVAARKLDPSFRLKKFISGAAGAFEIVVEGFAQKKREALKFLLSKDIYQEFEAEIEKREKEELEASTSVISLHEPEVLDVEVRGNICQVVVKFISEQISFIKNKAGEIIEGSKSQIDHVTEIWTFERDLTSKKPNWTVVGIQAA